MYEDLTNKKFGYWTVLGFAGHKTLGKKKKAIWTAQCRCGTIRDVCGESLRSGASKSCGCYKVERTKAVYDDILPNTKFGDLTVQYITDKRVNRRKVYHCICSCGNEVDVPSNKLISGKKKSCGCIKAPSKKRLQLTDMTFNYLYVVGFDSVKNGKTMWKCRCRCGTEVVVSGQALVTGGTKSCGCYNREQMTKRYFKDEIDNIYGFLKVYAFSHIGDNGLAYWKCECLNCGSKIVVNGAALRKGNTTSCGCIKSYGELHIANLLKGSCVLYKTQYWFPDLRGVGGGLLKFDFAILDMSGCVSCLIEVDGIQHFSSGTGWNTPENFEKVQTHDRLKNEYCAKHHIPLIRIPYTDLHKLQASDDYLLSLISPYLKSIPA